MQKQIAGKKVNVEFLEGAAMFALQGPKAQEILSEICSAPLSGLKYYHLMDAEIAGVGTRLSRSGYTGEDGFEICLDSASALVLWEALLKAGIPKGMQPIGLGARNTLRLEMGYALYGHEINRGTNPIEADLGWVVKLDKGEFIGSAAMAKMKQDGPQRRLVGFEMIDRGIARDGYAVVDASGLAIGEVCSGGPSPSTGKNIGLAYVPAELAALGSEFFISVRDKALKAQVVKKPFVQPSVLKN